MSYNELGSPYSARAITTHNTNELPQTITALYVGTGGDVRVLTHAGETVTFKNVQSGSYLFLKIRRVNTTGTTATDMIGLI